MNSYPDPNQAPAESLPFGEPEYREYPSARPPLRPQANAAGQRFPAPYPPAPVAARPMPPGRPPQPGGTPYPYGPAGQAFQQIPPFPVAKKNSHGWILILSLIGGAIIILVAVLIYAFSTISSSNPGVTNRTTTSGTNTGSTSQPGVVNLGQSITISGLTAIVLSVEPLAGDGTINPTAGNKYEVVNVRLQNNEDIAQLYNPVDFHVFNGDNQERDVESIFPDTYIANQPLVEGNIGPNSSVRGDLIIQVPTNDHRIKLGWSPGNVSSDSKYEWDLGL